MTASQVIDENGGSAAFARAIGSSADAVRMMKHRNKLPRSVWPEIVAAFPHLTLERLREVEASSHSDQAAA